jgi:hypothetical protein
MQAYEIPLSPSPQTFAIALGATTYQLTIVWNVPLACWILDIATEDGTPLVTGIPVVTGLDLLTQYEYLGFTGSLVVQTDGASSIVALIDGNSSVPVVGPGAWFIIGSSVIGGGDAIWGPTLGVTVTSGDGIAANIFPNDVPDFESLGVTGRLYFVVSP